MKYGKCIIGGREVWIATDEILRVQEDGTFTGTGRYLAAFNVKEPSLLLMGEIVQDDAQHAKEFITQTEAAKAAVAFAKHRIGEAKK